CVSECVCGFVWSIDFCSDYIFSVHCAFFSVVFYGYVFLLFIQSVFVLFYLFVVLLFVFFFFFSSRRRHTRSYGDWSSDVCSSDLVTLSIAASSIESVAASGMRITPTRSCSTCKGMTIMPDARSAANECPDASAFRSEERRVGKEWSTWWSREYERKKTKKRDRRRR